MQNTQVFIHNTQFPNANNEILQSRNVFKENPYTYIFYIWLQATHFQSFPKKTELSLISKLAQLAIC